MRIWVTGASGFVGGATLRRLSARGEQVVAIARPSSASVVNPRLATVVVADLPHLALLEDAPAPDAIVHCAAEIFARGPGAFARSRAVHVDATAALAHLARRHGARFVHLSTTDVYVSETSDGVIDEDSPTGPSPIYGRTKLEGELRLREVYPSAVILRPPGIYGPGSRADYVQYVTRKIARRRFVMVGDGRALRSWVYVENVVDAIERAVDGRVPSGTYLVDDGAPVSRGELLRTIARALGMAPRFPRLPVAIARLVARASERVCPPLRMHPPLTMHGVRFLTEGFALDTSRLRATGYVPSWDFERAIEETVRWVTDGDGR